LPGQNRRHQVRAVLLVHRERLIVAVRAVLDGVDAGANRGLDAPLAVRVRRDFHAEQMRGLDNRAHLLVGELLRIARVADRQHAAGCRELDQVGAVLVLITHGFPRFVRAVDDPVLPGGRLPQVRPQAALVAMPARNADDRARRPHARARHDAVLDRALQRDVRAAVGAHVANRRESRLERPPRVHRRSHRIIERRHRRGANDRVALTLAGDVRMRVDQAGHDG
jgi:hypothetical protein